MSKRFRRQLLRDFRTLAIEGYPGKVDKCGDVKRPIVRRQRWRRVTALWAKQQGWSFTDVWISRRYTDRFRQEWVRAMYPKELCKVTPCQP